MRSRRRRTRYARKSRLDRFALGALGLSAGLLAVSVLVNTEVYQNAPEAETRPPPARPAHNTQTSEFGQAPRSGDSPSSAAPEVPRAKRDSPATTAQFDDSQTPAPSPGASVSSERRASKPTEAPNDIVAADQPSSAVVTTAPAGRRIARDSEPIPSASDDKQAARDSEFSPSAVSDGRDTRDGDSDPSSSDMAKLETADESTDAAFSSNVARAQFSTNVVDREPVDRVGSAFPTNGEPFRTLYYFTELENMSGETVIHRWEYNGSVISEISFNIGSDRWRTWSSKQLTRGLTGQWRVSIVDARGRVLRSDSFFYGDS